MTKDCIKDVYKLQQESELFCDLTIEQLLFAAIIGSDFEEVKNVLEITNWSKYCPTEKGYMVKHYLDYVILMQI